MTQEICRTAIAWPNVVALGMFFAMIVGVAWAVAWVFKGGLE